MKSVDRAVNIYKTNSQMGRGSNSQSTFNYFEGGKSQPTESGSSKKTTHSFDQVLQSQIKKSNHR